MNVAEQDWPALPLEEWEATYRTLHMWTQIVGKIRLALTPLQNHFWNVALYVTARGLTTSPIPYRGSMFEIQFDFVNHRLELRTAEGDHAMVLAPKICGLLLPGDICAAAWRRHRGPNQSQAAGGPQSNSARSG